MSQIIKIENIKQLYKILLRTASDKQLFPSTTARNFIKKEIKDSFKKYKEEKNEIVVKIQLDRALQFLTASQ
jgi:hypothetical protein